MSKRPVSALIVLGMVTGCPFLDRSIGDLDGETDSGESSSTSLGPDLGDGDGDGDPGDGDPGDGDPGDGDGDGDPGDGDPGDGDPGDGDPGEPSVCGDGVVDQGEQCDDGMGNMDPKPGQCANDCTIYHCVWDVENLPFPIQVTITQNPLGQITFDGNCDLIVGAGLANAKIHRIDQIDGSIEVIADLGTDMSQSVPTGLTYRASDDRIYVGTVASDQLWAIDSNNPPSFLAGGTDNSVYHSLAVAPESFGELADQLIIANFGDDLLVAYDVENDAMSVVAEFEDTGPATLAFAPNGTLYVAEYDADRVSAVTPEGEITTFYEGLDGVAGLAVSPDGTRLFVTSRTGIGWAYNQQIDQLSIPGAQLTPYVDFKTEGGSLPSGLVVDGEDHVLYLTGDEFYSYIDYFDAL